MPSKVTKASGKAKEVGVSQVEQLRWMFDGKKMTFSKEVMENDDRTDEERTAVVLVSIANSINKDIQLTWDIPSNNTNKGMPVLDLEIWVEDMEGTKKVLHSFYKKKMTSPYTILKKE